jgi:hypothetical protein
MWRTGTILSCCCQNEVFHSLHSLLKYFWLRNFNILRASGSFFNILFPFPRRIFPFHHHSEEYHFIWVVFISSTQQGGINEKTRKKKTLWLSNTQQFFFYFEDILGKFRRQLSVINSLSILWLCFVAQWIIHYHELAQNVKFIHSRIISLLIV